MEKPKKRGRQPKATKETTAEPAVEKQDVNPVDEIPLEPLKSRGGSKRKAAAVPEAAPVAEKPQRKPAAKRAKAPEPVEESNGVEENGAPVAEEEVTEKVAPTKKSRSTKKDVVAAEKQSSNGEVEESKSKGKKVTARKGKKMSEEPVVEKEVVEEQPPAPTKRGRAKVATKKEDDSEAVAIAKPKGRGKAKDKEADDNEGVTKTKSAASPSIEPTTKAAKASARGRKKAVPTVEDDVAVASAPVSPSKAVDQPRKGRTRRAVVPSVAIGEAGNDPDTSKGKKKDTSEKPTNGDIPTVTQRKRAKPQPPPVEEEDIDNEPAPPKGKKTKAAAPAAAAPKMNKCATDYASLSFELAEDKPWNFKISSWNVAGLRSWIGKGGFEFLEHEKPDILCVQETKCTEDQLPDEARHIKGYHPYWLCKPGGYAGVAIYSKKMPIHVVYGLGDEEQDQDGRLLTAEYEKFYLVCVYVPNAGKKLVTLPKRLRWNEKFHQYLRDLDAKKPVILCGDMNVAHEEIDLANPKTNRKNAGFTQEERDGMTDLLSLGFVDTFRKLYPDRTGAYTFWTYMGGARAKNVGWRLDYFITSERLVSKGTDRPTAMAIGEL